MKLFYLVVGSIGVALGAVAAVVPLVPSFPFLLLAFICFGKSSERLDTWFRDTKLYKENLEGFITKQGMSRASKVRVMITITLVMSIGFVMMHQIRIGQVILGIVWVAHIFYFIFGIKTKAEPKPET